MISDVVVVIVFPAILVAFFVALSIFTRYNNSYEVSRPAPLQLWDYNGLIP